MMCSYAMLRDSPGSLDVEKHERKLRKLQSRAHRKQHLCPLSVCLSVCPLSVCLSRDSSCVAPLHQILPPRNASLHLSLVIPPVHHPSLYSVLSPHLPPHPSPSEGSFFLRLPPLVNSSFSSDKEAKTGLKGSCSPS